MSNRGNLADLVLERRYDRKHINLVIRLHVFCGEIGRDTW